VAADKLITVSQAYAQEVVTEKQEAGLELLEETEEILEMDKVELVYILL
jgi:hypothetical protein